MAENPLDAPRQLVEIPQWMNTASSFFVIVLGGVYVLGLLIINIDLGRNGLISLNLGRPEYILAGALWAFLSIGMLGAVMVLSDAVREFRLSMKENPWKRLYAVIRLVVIIFGVFYIFDLALTLLSRSQVAFWFTGSTAWRIALVTYSVVGYNAWILYVIFRMVGNLGKTEQPLSPKFLFSAAYAEYSPFHVFVYGLSALSIYALAAYPLFAKEFGGGNKPHVKFYLSTESFKATKLHLPIDKSDDSIGPVALIFESEAMFFVRPLNKDESKWGPWFATEGDTTGIAKGLVQALTYVRDKNQLPTIGKQQAEPANLLGVSKDTESPPLQQQKSIYHTEKSSPTINEAKQPIVPSPAVNSEKR